MKVFAAILVALAWCPVSASEAQGMGSRLYVVSGNVLVEQVGDLPRLAVNGEALVSGTRIDTGDNSTALLRFEDGQVVTMQANSAFQVREYRYDPAKPENSRIVFVLLGGGARFITGRIGRQRNKAFKLLTPNATIGFRGSDVMLEMVGRSLYGQVLAGKVGITDAAGTTVLDAGQSVVVARGRPASVISPSEIPSGTFSKLASIPVEPTAIAAPPREVVAAGRRSGSGSSQGTPSHGAGGKKTVASIGVAGKIGTLGFGAEMDFGISDTSSFRLGLNGYSKRHNAHSSLLKYDFDLQLLTAMAVVDWYPIADSFRASIGVAYDKNRIGFDANDTGGNYIINTTSYSTSQVGSLSGRVSFNKFAPYIGIGWGSPGATARGWGVVSDIGVLFQGNPIVDLKATCIDAAICSQLQVDIEAEKGRMYRDLDVLKWWPVASIGISYRW